MRERWQRRGAPHRARFGAQRASEKSADASRRTLAQIDAADIDGPARIRGNVVIIHPPLSFVWVVPYGRQMAVADDSAPSVRRGYSVILTSHSLLYRESLYR